MTLSYAWSPHGTTAQYKPPTPGTLVGWEHAVWRVISAADIPKDRWTDAERKAVAAGGATYRPVIVVVLPYTADTDTPGTLDQELRLVCHEHTVWFVYDSEHWPACGRCGEPAPCREQTQARVAAAAAARMERYSIPGVCPACQQLVTARQRSITIPDNLFAGPAGPVVTFHLRDCCWGFAVDYEARWAAGDPSRRTTLSCRGSVTTHNDGTYECTEMTGCPGPRANHPSCTVCDCPGCHAKGDFGWELDVDAVLRRGGERHG